LKGESVTDIKAKLEELRDKRARRFCRNWPAETYYPPDLQAFYEEGADLLLPLLADAYEALKFYAAEANYHASSDSSRGRGIGGQMIMPPLIYDDEGRRARAAMARIEAAVAGEEK
jgi:hypothetical protein